MTVQKIKTAIFHLLTGMANAISDTTGDPIPSGKPNNDAFQNATTKEGAPVYNEDYSIFKHLTSKEKLSTIKTKGMNSTVELDFDPTTSMPKYNIVTSAQSEYPAPPKENGSIAPTELQEGDVASVTPSDYMNDVKLQHLLNSMVVTISNTVAEAITKIIMAKIENNQTEIYIEWDPSQLHQIDMLNAMGSVSPASINCPMGTISFKPGIEYTHKCRIKFGNL